MTRSWLGALLAGVLALAVGTGAAAAQSATWEIDPDRSTLLVHVDAAGLFSPVLEDHLFTPDAWTGRIRFDPERPETTVVEVSVVADSLRNLQQDLSADDRQTVARQVRSPDILDVQRYPEIRFSADRLEVESVTRDADGAVLTGTVHGRLTVRDVTRPLPLPVEARWSAHRLRAAGTTEFLAAAP